MLKSALTHKGRAAEEDQADSFPSNFSVIGNKKLEKEQVDGWDFGGSNTRM